MVAAGVTWNKKLSISYILGPVHIWMLDTLDYLFLVENSNFCNVILPYISTYDLVNEFFGIKKIAET